jgi:hypothetical protein
MQKLDAVLDATFTADGGTVQTTGHISIQSVGYVLVLIFQYVYRYIY